MFNIIRRGISFFGIPFLFFKLLGLTSTYASFSCDDNYKSAHIALLKLDYQSAKNKIELGINKTPTNHLYTLLSNYTAFLQCITADDYQSYQAFKKTKKHNIETIEADTGNIIWKLYCLAEIRLQFAFAEAKFGEYLSSVNDINKAYDYLLKITAKAPDFLPAKKCLGLLLVLIGNVPDEYKWASSALGFKGDVPLGLKLLKECYATSKSDSKWNYLKSENLFYYAFTLFNLGNNDAELMSVYADLKTSSADNVLLSYAAGSVALRIGKNDDALEIFENKMVVNASSKFPYLYYLMGLAHLNQLDTLAANYFTKYLNSYKGINYVKASYHNIARCYLLADNASMYDKTIQNILKSGATKIDEDFYAEKEAKSNTQPNVYLLKARLLFDGGYYHKALSMLVQKTPSEIYMTNHDFLEYKYRMARIYDKTHNVFTAIELYGYVYEMGKKLPYYFAANSALNLGLIYEQQNNYSGAAYYFKLALQLKNYEYKNSIQLKAKAGLNRVQKK